MGDPVDLHKPIHILEPKPWENTLNQLRALMKNVVVNHDRIRERINELKERYFEGQMDDGAVNWERWAIAHFAYSPRYLRVLTSPHPLQMDRWEAQRQRAAHQITQRAKAEDKKRAQAVWNAWPSAYAKAEQHDVDFPEWEAADKKYAKLLKDKERKRVQREAAKKVPVSQSREVIDRMVKDYKALPRADQRIFLALIGVQLRTPAHGQRADSGKMREARKMVALKSTSTEDLLEQLQKTIPQPEGSHSSG